MIVVRLEMWPKGDESRKYELGRTYIYNAGGPGTSTRRGNYEVRVCRKGSYEIDHGRLVSGEGFTRTARVLGYPRQAYNIWRLIIKALRLAFPEERG